MYQLIYNLRLTQKIFLFIYKVPKIVRFTFATIKTMKQINDFILFSAGLDGAQRLLVANSQAAIQNMMNQQNAALRGAHVGGAPLILSPRIQVPTSLASGLLNGSGNQPPPLIAAGDTQQLLYAQYAAAASAADYSNYAGLVNPLLAAEYSTADPSGGLFAR